MVPTQPRPRGSSGMVSITIVLTSTSWLDRHVAFGEPEACSKNICKCPPHQHDCVLVWNLNRLKLSSLELLHECTTPCSQHHTKFTTHHEREIRAWPRGSERPPAGPRLAGATLGQAERRSPPRRAKPPRRSRARARCRRPAAPCGRNNCRRTKPQNRKRAKSRATGATACPLRVK